MDTVQESIKFIETDLVPEMVHNRCFSEQGSREFVDLDSVSAEPLQTTPINANRELYRAQVVIKFSGEPTTFFVIIKLLPLGSVENDLAYGRFLNEEMFYSKMTAKYHLDIYPKCYVADMGRYGRPVIVLEDLTAIGYCPVALELNKKQTKMCFDAIVKFISRGLELKCEQFEIFREFYSKLIVTDVNEKLHLETLNKNLQLIRQKLNTGIIADILNRMPESFQEDDKFFTICHGNLTANHLMFLYEKDEPIRVRIIGWNQLRYTLPGIDLKYIFCNKLQHQRNSVNNPDNFNTQHDELLIHLLDYFPYIQSDEIQNLWFNLFHGNFLMANYS